MKAEKKYFDQFLAAIALLVSSPVFLGICLWVYLDSPGPIFFRQKRVGMHKQYFEILKFRTMRADTPKDVPTHLLKNPEKYITRSGRFLRKTSLDELPQLINILRGEMAIVGPRPALWNQYNLIEERDRYGANDVLPGLTGWAQIHGRDTISVKEKAELDGYYVMHRGLWIDLQCILLTIGYVLRHEGVLEGGPRKKNVSEEPLVSVIVATYHRDQELGRALASLASQSYPCMEVILVDDNADAEWNARVEQWVKRWKEKSDLPLIYIRNEENKGSAASRNLGIAAAHGSYVTFLDDDDKYLVHKIRHQLYYMMENRIDYCLTDLALYNEDGKLMDRRVRSYLTEKIRTDTEALFTCHLMYHMTGTDTLMFRKEYLDQIGGFPPIDLGDEFYLMKEAILAGGKIGYLPVCEVKALVHTDTAGLSSRDVKIRGENALYEYKKQFFDKLSAKDRRQITMRHHTVLAYAYMRSRNYPKFLEEGSKAFLVSPTACLRMAAQIKIGRYRHRRK